MSCCELSVSVLSIRLRYFSSQRAVTSATKARKDKVEMTTTSCLDQPLLPSKLSALSVTDGVSGNCESVTELAGPDGVANAV